MTFLSLILFDSFVQFYKKKTSLRYTLLNEFKKSLTWLASFLKNINKKNAKILHRFDRRKKSREKGRGGKKKKGEERRKRKKKAAQFDTICI